MNSNLLAIFRADAGFEIGGGHVFRCLTLADVLAANGWTCVFVSTNLTSVAVPSLRQSQHKVIEIDQHDAASPDPVEKSGPAALLIVDHYGLNHEFETACRPFVDRIMVIDDVPNRSHDCDLILDQTLGRTPADYLGLVAPDATHLLGPDFALIRPTFASLRKKTLKRHRDRIERVFVSFGAVDPLDLCSTAAMAAIEASVECVDIAVSSSCQHLDSLFRFDKVVKGITVHVDADIAELMSKADLAIGAMGSMSWERCCLGLPSIGMVIADNQREIANALSAVKAAAIIQSGANASKSAVSEEIGLAIAAINETAGKLHLMSKAAASICDGQGAMRAARGLLA